MNTIDLENTEQKFCLESPSTQKRRIENEKFKNEWAICCSKTNKEFLKYLVQIIMGGSVLCFSMIQILRGAKHSEIYFRLLSGVIGSFMPHPQIKNDL